MGNELGLDMSDMGGSLHGSASLHVVQGLPGICKPNIGRFNFLMHPEDAIAAGFGEPVVGAGCGGWKGGRWAVLGTFSLPNLA